MASKALPYQAQSLYYDGQAQKPGSGRAIDVIEPSNGQTLIKLEASSNEDVDKAITSAQKAFPSWSTTPPSERSRILLKAAQILRDRNEALAEVETRDTGKPFSETSTVDIVSGADVLEFYAHLVSGGGLNGESIQLREDAWVYTQKAALGVCAGIGAWNYPLQIALWKSAPCLAAGNTMVYKPSEYTPLHGAELAAVYTAAGLPPGCFNVVNGHGAVGAYLASHPSIAKVSFTGQVSTGQKVASEAAKGMKYVTMELGGKSPLIVCADASVDDAVDVAMMANFYSTGQVCTNGTRVFVPESMKEAFEKLLVDKIGKFVRAGDLMDPKTNFGPLSSALHHQRVSEYISHGIDHDKATLLCGGTIDDSNKFTSDLPQALQKGYWIAPTVFTNCHDTMRICQEEIFGPVLCILTYSSIDEAVERANATHLGLAAGVVTKDVKLAHRITARLEAGITWVNSWGESPAEMSVGGWKMSGVGVENGRRGIEAWVRSKSTLVDTSGKVASVFA